MKAFFTKYISLVLAMLLVFFTINTAKAQPCISGETEINFVVNGANGGFTNYVVLQETTGESSLFSNTVSSSKKDNEKLRYSLISINELLKFFFPKTSNIFFIIT